MPAGTLVTAKLLKDDSTFLSANTDAAGFAEFQANGSPGQLYLEATIGGETRRVYGSISGQVLTWFQAELPQVLAVYGDGYLSTNPHGTAAVTPGSGLTVVVAGGALLAQGVLGTFYTPTTLTIAANASGATRLDRVVYRVYLTGVDLGKTELAVKTGTTVAPALQQDANVWEVALATVSVPNGAGALVGANITDTRVAVTAPLGDGTVTAAKLDSASITEFVQDVVGTEIVPGVGLTKTYDDTAGTVTLDTALATKSGNTTRVAKTAALSFDSSAFSVSASGNQATIDLIATPTSVASGEGKSDGTITSGLVSDTRTFVFDDLAFGATPVGAFLNFIFPNFGDTAGRIAEGNHEHSGAKFDTGVLAGRTVTGSGSFDSTTLALTAGITYDVFCLLFGRASGTAASGPGSANIGITLGGNPNSALPFTFDNGVDSTFFNIHFANGVTGSISATWTTASVFQQFTVSTGRWLLIGLPRR